MYISDIFKTEKVTVSLEVFPPKPDIPMESVTPAIRALSKTEPAYMSVTYGAGGGNTANAVEVSSLIQNELQTTALAHLTCIGASREKILEILGSLRQNNIQNILALRGDFPSGDYDHSTSAYPHASDLVREIRDYGGFCIGGACYPEGHIENANADNDIDNLKYKIDAGVEFLVSQLFFDNNMFYSFLYKLAAKGINVPVTAGIMPVTTAGSIRRMCKLSGATLTPKFRAMVDRFEDKPAALRQAGILYASEQIVDLVSNGVKRIHIYTLNNPGIAEAILENIKGVID